MAEKKKKVVKKAPKKAVSKDNYWKVYLPNGVHGFHDKEEAKAFQKANGGEMVAKTI